MRTGDSEDVEDSGDPEEDALDEEEGSEMFMGIERQVREVDDCGCQPDLTGSPLSLFPRRGAGCDQVIRDRPMATRHDRRRVVARARLMRPGQAGPL